MFLLDDDLRTPIPPEGAARLNYQDQAASRHQVGKNVARYRLRPDNAAPVCGKPASEDENKNEGNGEQPEPGFKSPLITTPHANGFN
ncbi:MAG: hypothetical protein WAM13_18550 [Candidatus Sulfotelmatobacter sp.]